MPHIIDGLTIKSGEKSLWVSRESIDALLAGDLPMVGRGGPIDITIMPNEVTVPILRDIFVVDFDCINPVGCGLIIAAIDINEAMKIAKETVTHTEIEEITKVERNTSKVVFYQSGEY